HHQGFTGGLADICYGDPLATADRVMTAAEHAGVSDFAVRLPSGLDTEVGEHGRQLSGGQRWVAVARALLPDAQLLLLDEPTTAIAATSEGKLIGRLIAATRGKTVLLAPHQPRLIAAADQLLQIEDSHVAVTRWDRRLAPL